MRSEIEKGIVKDLYLQPDQLPIYVFPFQDCYHKKNNHKMSLCSFQCNVSLDEK